MEIREALAAVRNGGEIDTARDPRAAGELGTAIAAQLRAHRPDAVLCWVGDDESVLAHVVAHELGVPVLRAVEEMGLLTIDGALREGMRVVLLATRFGGRNLLEPLRGLAVNAGAAPVAVASVLGASTPSSSGVGTGMPTIVMEGV